MNSTQISITNNPTKKWTEDWTRYLQTTYRCQQVHEKILNTLIRDVQIKIHKKISHMCQNGFYQKSLQIANIGEDMEKRAPLYTVEKM